MFQFPYFRRLDLKIQGALVCVKAAAYKVSVTFAAPSPVTMHVVLSITTTIPYPS